MKIFRKQAILVGHIIYHGTKINEFRCPVCDHGVSEEYICCPYCGQKFKFKDTTKEGE